MGISQETVEEVLRIANVYDVISDYINLEKAGSNYRALCPFHAEKTPSFMVSPQKNIFKCFGCGKSGNAVSFLMEYEGLSFGEAVIKLAEKYNIPVGFTGSDEGIKHKKRLIFVAEKVKDFYKAKLKSSKEAKAYIKRRELRPEMIELFDIGYAPLNSQELIDYIQKEGIAVDELIKIGVVSLKENDRITDRFSGRVIFPIKDQRGNTVGFGGRVIDERQPKYINSPETELYSKSKILYGYYEAKEYLREKKEAIVVEGYLDLISLFQIGIRNVVATLGTVLTPQHGKLLSKFVSRVILMFDSDSAGKKATVKAAKALLGYGMEVYYCPLEKGKDPDEVAKEGIKRVEEQIKNSKDFLLFLLERVQKQKDLKKRKEIIDLYLDILSYHPDRHVRGLYIRELSDKTGIPVELLSVEPKKAVTEDDSSVGRLNIPEKIVLKGLILFKDEILSKFDKFDKIIGSAYFLYTLNEILEGGELEELEEIKGIDIPVSPETVLNTLNNMHKNWIKQQNELDATFLSSVDESVIQKIFQNKKSLYTGGSKKK
ncbi:DNA primase [Persephonella atlantica]|uniref:DNA primase n=1 Tax=Persephonella atlantica TaxID=2699429 RepID=A0ABS1GEV0_9AQUI|nr:DNA primase [Persephonella atlantica]MBK3331471.1 DNA primase [Persephonella atlantica]